MLSKWSTKILVDFVCGTFFLTVIIFLPKDNSLSTGCSGKGERRDKVQKHSTVHGLHWYLINLFLNSYREYYWHSVSNKIIVYKTKSKYTRTIFPCRLWGLCHKMYNTIWYTCVAPHCVQKHVHTPSHLILIIILWIDNIIQILQMRKLIYKEFKWFAQGLTMRKGSSRTQTQDGWLWDLYRPRAVILYLLKDAFSPEVTTYCSISN